MNKGMLFSQGGYVKSAPVPVFPDAGEEFFWRIVNFGEEVELQLRQYRKVIGSKRSWIYGTRGPFLATPENINAAAISLLNSLTGRQRNRNNAARWAGDYLSTKEVNK